MPPGAGGRAGEHKPPQALRQRHRLPGYTWAQPQAGPPTGKKVAVIGGGAGGLSAAYYLALMGHAPHHLRGQPPAGRHAALRHSEYRLPKAVLDREIEAILAVGVEARTDQIWGRDFSLESLKQRGFTAIFLGTGAAVNRGAEIPDRGYRRGELRHLLPGPGGLGQDTGVGKRVAVIGGGNTPWTAPAPACVWGPRR